MTPYNDNGYFFDAVVQAPGHRGLSAGSCGLGAPEPR